MTKLQIAKTALMFIESGCCDFICNAIILAANDYREKALKIIPELIQFKPPDVFPEKVWFKGPNSREKRVEVLKELIKLLENDSNLC